LVVLLPGKQLVLSVPPAPRPLVPELVPPVPVPPVLLPGLVGPLPLPPRVPLLLPPIPPEPPLPPLPPLPPPLDWANAGPDMEIIAAVEARASAKYAPSARKRRRAMYASVMEVSLLELVVHCRHLRDQAV
jgi:hypothetical protein